MKKLIAIATILSVAVMLGGASVSKATTVEDLQATIASLQEQLNAALAQLSALGGTTTGAVTSCTFTRNLYPGMTGADVKCLQQYLNGAGYTVAATGVGSAGNETEYYGSLTQAAVKAWQDANGVAYGNYPGYFGPVSRAKYTEVAATTGTGTGTGTETGGETGEETTTTEGTEGILTVAKNASPAAGAKLYEGDSDVAVLGLKAKAQLSDITIQRIKFNFGATRPYDYINHLAVYDGDTLVGETDLDSSTVYKSGGVYYLQLTGLNTKVAKDETKVLTVKVNAVSSVSGSLYSTLSKSITLTVEANGVRGIDTAGVDQYAPSVKFSNSFSINASQISSATLTFSKASDSPSERNIVSDSNGNVSEAEMLRMNAKATKDDIKITDATATIATTAGIALPSTAYLYDGTDLVGTAVVSNGNAVFTDLEITVPKDSTKVLTVKADYTGASSTESTSTVAIAHTNITAEKSNGSNLTAISGDVTSSKAHIYTVAPELALSNATINVTHGDSTSSSTADATITFTMTAKGGNVTVSSTGAIVPKYATSSNANATATGIAGTYTMTGATLSGGVYTIAEDTTATVTVKVHVTENLPVGYKNAYGHVLISSITWNDTHGTTWVSDDSNGYNTPNNSYMP